MDSQSSSGSWFGILVFLSLRITIIETVQRINFKDNFRYCPDYCSISALLVIRLVSAEIAVVSKLTEVCLVWEITAFYKKPKVINISGILIFWIFGEFRSESILRVIYRLFQGKLIFLILLSNYFFISSACITYFFLDFLLKVIRISNMF